MSTWIQDLRYGLRMLARTPVVTAVAALSLAAGIAANASIFALLDGFLLEPLPYHDQDGLVLVREGRQDDAVGEYDGPSVGSFRDYEEGVGAFQSSALYTVVAANLTGVDVPEEVNVVPTTPDLFDVLGVQPALGRSFRQEEGNEGAGNVVVLEHDFWARRFLSDPDVLGRTLTLDGTAYTIVGVMPKSFDLIPANVHVFRPTAFAELREDRTSRDYIAISRLVPGASVERAQQEVQDIWARTAAEHPEATRGMRAAAVGARDFFPGSTDEQLVMILTIVSLFGLLIACANVANLLLARAEERQKEVAVRTALGAGRLRILRQLLTESVMLGVGAGAVGLGLSVLVVRWIQSAMPAELPAAMMPRLDPKVLVATLAVSVLAGVVFGLAPALHTARGDLREALGEGSRGGTASRSRRRLRNAFVVGEFAVALALLTGAGFLIQAFTGLTSSDPGFRQDGLLTFSIAVPEHRYPAPADLRVFEDELLASLQAIPGVEGVTAMSSLPRGRANPSTRYTIEGRPVAPEGEQPTAALQSVTPGYFDVLRIPVEEGRGLADTDREGGQPVAVVSRSFARKELTGSDPLGRSLRIAGEETSRIVVGVVADIVQDRIPAPGAQAPAVYVPLAQRPLRAPSFALRVSGDPSSVSGDVRRAVQTVDPDQPVARLQTLDAFVAESLAGPHTISRFLAAMGVVALLLAALGIYGVMAHAVAQQQREIGIRMALGAGRRSVVGMITRGGLTLAGAGMLLGLPLAWMMYRRAALALDVFQAPQGLAWAGGVVVVTLGLVATVATWLPAQRASGIAPISALRD